jgi:hypothetical protein
MSGPTSGPKQLQVFQRKEVPSFNPAKSWVAERCSWNSEVGLLGKNPMKCLVTKEATARATLAMDEPETTGLQGELKVQAGENTCVEDSSSQIEVVVMAEDIERKEQGQESMAPASKDLKLVWEVKGIAGLSWDRQEGKLKDVLGQLVTNKSGAGLLLRLVLMQMIP